MATAKKPPKAAAKSAAKPSRSAAKSASKPASATKAKSARPGKAKPVPKPARKTARKTAAKAEPRASSSAPQAVPADAGTSGPNPAKSGYAVLGELVWLLGQSKVHGKLSASELLLRYLPAINASQVRMFYAKGRVIGAAIWAQVDDEIDQTLARGGGFAKESEWSGGGNFWLIDLIAPFGAEKIMLQEMKETVFKNRDVKYRGTKDGASTIFTL